MTLLKDTPYKIINNKQDAKSWYWFIEIYPDSCKDNYLQLLRQSAVVAAISPWHDHDIGEDGNLLKPHKHVLLCFSGSAKITQVISIIDMIGAKQQCMTVNNKYAAFKYLYHSDSPDKAMYRLEDIEYSNCDKFFFANTAFKDLLNYIDEYHCISLHQLTLNLRKDNNDYLLEYVAKNCYYINSYIAEIRDKKLSQCYNIIANINTLYDKFIYDNDLDMEALIDIHDRLQNLGIKQISLRNEL